MVIEGECGMGLTAYRYIDRYQIDYIVHGDDPCFTPDGRDV
jgi:hypothetical protein